MNWSIVVATILSTWLAFQFLIIDGEFYSSMHKMSSLMDVEVYKLEIMTKFIGKNENKLNFLKERLAEYERERDEALSTGPVYFENPINKYLLTKRLTSDWEKIENVMQYKEGEKSLQRIVNGTVDESELIGAVDGLLRLQDVYRLNTSDMARGLLQGVQYAWHFEARHCYDIGKRALETNLTKLAHAWLVEALTRSTKEDTIDKLDIKLAIADAKFQLGDIQGSNQTYTDLVRHHPASEKVAKLFSEFSQAAEGKQSVEVDYSVEHVPPLESIYLSERHDLYKHTCAGIIKKDPEEERYLRCGYLTETHPFLILAPIKVEELNHDPLLVLFHDVMADSEIKTLKQLTKSIQRATVMSPNGSVVSEVRTSQFQFLPVTHHPLLAIIDQRVADMTNLNMNYSEQHQFANYGIGGHYAEHHDYFVASAMEPGSVSQIELGNRIATVLFYLSDVEQGGGTAFPFMKQVTLPKKGSAAFWYNLHASGEPDERTLHGACPIIVGSKWVQNRWIREYDQSDCRPCYTYDDSILS